MGRRQAGFQTAPATKCLAVGWGSAATVLACRQRGAGSWKAVGSTPDIWANWPTAWVISWLIAFPTVMVVLPLVLKLVELPGQR